MPGVAFFGAGKKFFVFGESQVAGLCGFDGSEAFEDGFSISNKLSTN